jgi:Cupin-like domain
VLLISSHRCVYLLHTSLQLIDRLQSLAATCTTLAPAIQQQQQQQQQRNAEYIGRNASADATSATISTTTTAAATTKSSDTVDTAQKQSAVQQQQQQQQSPSQAALCTAVPLLLQPPSLLCFLSTYMEQQRPVVIRGAMQHWPALQQWHNFNYLKYKAGFRTVPVEVSKLHFYYTDVSMLRCM